MLRKLKEILVGVALLLVVYFLERRANAAECAAFRKGEDGATGGDPPPHPEPLPHTKEGNVARKLAVPKWLWVAFLLVAIGVLFGCAGRRHYGFTTQTVFVENQSIETLKIYVYPMGSRIGSIQPGRSECLTLPTSEQELTLVAVPIGGGRNSMQYSPPFRASQSWAWEVGNRNTIDGFSGMLIFRSPCR